MKLFDAYAALQKIEKQADPPASFASPASNTAQTDQKEAKEAKEAAPRGQIVKMQAVPQVRTKSAFRNVRGQRPGVPLSSPTCTICGQSDWTVALTFPDGQKAHVECAKHEGKLK